MEPVAILRDVSRGPLRAATLDDLAAWWRDGVDEAVLRERASRELGAVTTTEFEAWIRACGGASAPHAAAVTVLGTPIEAAIGDGLPWGHPAVTLRAEAEAIESHVLMLESGLASGELTDHEPSAVAPPAADPVWDRWATLVDPLLYVEAHFAKKEHQWFPVLEERGIVRPSLVMWQADDRVRHLLSRLRGDLDRCASADAQATATELIAALRRVLRAELTVLVPLALDTLDEGEWTRVRKGEAAYGYCLIADPPNWPAAQPTGANAAEGHAVPAVGIGRDALPMGAIALTRGGLTVAQALGVLASLPVDLTFVDADDRVRFFNRTPRPVFKRSAGAIGREVRYCHPPKSVHMVLEIVEAFRAGAQDVAEFWFTGRQGLVHIRYFALRDAAGAYRGVLEVSQDVGELRNASVGPLDVTALAAPAARDDARRPARAVAPPGSFLMDEGLLTAEQLDLVLSHLPMAVGVHTDAAGWHYLNRADIDLLAPSEADAEAVALPGGRVEAIAEWPTEGRAWMGLASLDLSGGEGFVAMTQWLAPLDRLEGERRILDWSVA